MAAPVAKTVKDVSPHEFVKAYSSHLKRSGKVYSNSFFFFIKRRWLCIVTEKYAKELLVNLAPTELRVKVEMEMLVYLIIA